MNRNSIPGTSQVEASAEKLRLCYISNPNTIHTRRWVSWFARRGHIVCLLADVPLKEPWPGVDVIDLSRFFWAPVIRFGVWAAWLRRFLHQWQPDILHAHRVNSAGWLAAASGFHPYVVTPWGSDVLIGPQRSWAARILAGYTLRHADLVTTISQAISDRVIQLGARSDHLRSISHGVNLQIFYPGPKSNVAADTLRQRLALPGDARLIFSPRAVHPIYNQDILLKAIPAVQQEFPQARFILVDYNPDPAYRQELARLISSLDLESSISWLPATGDPAEMAERYRACEIVVSVPSSDGGTPLSVLEAMACARSVVCTDLPAVREFVHPGETGWLVPVRQVEPLAEAIISLLKNPDRAAGFGHKAHQLVAEKANQEVEMGRMEALYYQLAKSCEA